jgi:aconitate hydratase
MASGPFDSLQTFETPSGPAGRFSRSHNLKRVVLDLSPALPISIRIVLESVLRNCDGEKITEQNVKALANWQPNGRASG